MGKRSKFFWHVPGPSCWFVGPPVALGGNANVAGDIVVTLISAEGGEGNRPELDNFVVERIVGQYMFTADESVAVRHHLHSRVYVADADASSIALRVLTQADDAETSFLWHQVDPWDTAQDGTQFGSWNDSGAGARPRVTPWMGRNGHVDIKVGRQIGGGRDLIWHTTIVNAPAADNTFYLKLWLRMLVREA